NSFDARFNKTFDVTLNTSGNILYSFITDNEMETIEGTITITPKPPTPTPNPTPEPPTPTPNLTPEINNNKTSNAIASTTMKKTGIPINMILIILLSVLGALIGKKRY
ncbi:hypothetical protein KQY27_03560, partial [Methanobrevibacter sp. TMH8]|nr:hypothetical protein [Methanobrevibacter sp. TMH8]